MFPAVGEIRNTRKQYNYKMMNSGIAAFEDVEKLEANALKSGELPQKTKELIALGISIAHACYG
jgi:alkylhydroperoxidase/carboxymuconolactone decarboxylase family protein YurZ